MGKETIALQLLVTSFVSLRKIKDIKQYTVDEGKKVNDSLKAYQQRYDRQLQDLENELDNKYNEENEY